MFSGEEYTEATPEVKAEMDRLNNEDMVFGEIMKSVASSIPQEVPDGTDTLGWTYGSYRVAHLSDAGVNKIAHEYTLPEMKAIRLLGFYRQTAKRKNDITATGFCSTVPLDFIGQVVPGQEIRTLYALTPRWNLEEAEAMARESFLALQKMVKDFYNE